MRPEDSLISADSSSSDNRIMKIVCITGNMMKRQEITKSIENCLPELLSKLEFIDIDMDEVQGDPAYVSRRKLEMSVDALYENDCIDPREVMLIVEDTSLDFKAWGPLPGVYTKQFVRNIGVPNFPKLLAGFEEKGCISRTVLSVYDKCELHQFIGEAYGNIVEPRGREQGFDSVFEECESKMTFGEMTVDQKVAVSHRSKAIAKWVEYVKQVHS